MRRAKIVCTLGPSSNSPPVLRQLISTGLDVARLNFSHGSYDDHRAVFEMIREISDDLGKPVAILQDLQGPKIRVGRFEDDFVVLERGAEFTISVDDFIGNADRVSTTYKGLARDVRPSDILLLDDGMLRMRVIDVKDTDVRCLVEVGGRLSNNKGINLPTAAVSAPSMTEKDKEDLEFGLELGFDYVALSFVRSALDIHQLRATLPESVRESTKIISKIEKPQAIDNLDQIIAVSEGIMIARGDLGVEMPPQKVPVLQKQAIAKANAAGRISITATQMLESMTDNPRPTRAEASDVANAILDGSDAVMLSGETAAGRYPVEAVQMMASIIEEVEAARMDRGAPVPPFIRSLKTFPNAVAKSASIAADELDVLGIVVLTLSGATARLMMTYRPRKPIIAVTPDPAVCRQMAMYWGVQPNCLAYTSEEATPVGLDENTQTTDELISTIEQLMEAKHGAKPGDEIIIVMGVPVEDAAETNLIKFHRIS